MADEIVLWLSEEDFPNKLAELPAELLRLEGEKGFCIKWVKENLKSHKKYFYALQEYRDCIVITVDDDMHYARTMVGTLLESYYRHPNSISARNVHRIFRKGEKIAPYRVWEGRKKEYINVERIDMCAIGVNGILYPPGCATEKWFDFETIYSCAENQDDLWLKYNQIRDGIPVVYTGMGQEDIEIEDSQNTYLSQKNVLEGGNDRCIERLCAHVLGQEKIIFNNWMNQLMTVDEYVRDRIYFYKLELEEIFNCNINTNIYICGAGKYATILLDFINKMHRKDRIKGFLVSGENVVEEIDGIRILKIDDLDEKDSLAVVCGVSAKYEYELKDIISKKVECKWFDIDIQGIAYCARLLEDLVTK